MTTPEGETAQLIEQIHQSIAELRQAIIALTCDRDAVIARLRRTVWWIAAGLALDLLLTMLGVTLWLGQQQANVEIAANNDRISTLQVRASTEVLCPLYDVFLDSYDPTSPEAAHDPAEYEHSFTVIEEGARVLGCEHATRGRN